MHFHSLNARASHPRSTVAGLSFLTVLLVLGVIATTAGPLAAQEPSAAAAEPVTLPQIMAHPDWLGNAPEGPYWADDGDTVFHLQKRPGEDIRDLVEVSLTGEVLRRVAPENLGEVSVAGGEWSRDGRRKVWEREGDLYLRREDGRIRQLTRTHGRESDPRFLADEEHVTYQRDGEVYVRHLASGLESQVAVLLTEDSPEEQERQREEEGGYLYRQQERLFRVLREREARRERAREHAEQERAADPTRAPNPVYLGDDVQILDRSLSPSGEHLLVVTAAEDRDLGADDRMPDYVSRTGYVDVEEVRPKVGTPKPGTERLALLSLATGELTELDLAALPGITDDPLAELREAAEARKKARDVDALEDADEQDDAEGDSRGDGGDAEDGGNGEEEEKEEEEEDEPRPLRLGDVHWSPDGRWGALFAFSLDNKDRWILLVDTEDGTLSTPHRLHDPAWINWSFNELGWIPGRTGEAARLFFLSEEHGFSQIHLLDPAAAAEAPARRLTSGEWEASQVVADRRGRHLYFLGNREHPGRYEVYRVDVEGGEVERLTETGGITSFELAPNSTPEAPRLLLRHSTITRPWELMVQEPGEPARRITHTVSEEYAGVPWVEPEIVPIPSPHSEPPVHAKVYRPTAPSPLASGKRPAVVFIHGAGYLQNVHRHWSYYFREFMFHTFLAQRGFVVLDMDYRASAGYGRDWRTAIYRHMGGPEVEDLAAGVEWLAEHEGVDPERVGVYGGSYGGFLTFMSLFTEPELFAAGAALRPVTDWAHYNHPYTSNILNTPELDPEAYERSSPIEHAEGLEAPLLIAHGVLDDNVVFQDTVRLVQRLIELEKEDWEAAMYPLEPHGFREPSSWLDEYRRIWKLFRTHLLE